MSRAKKEPYQFALEPSLKARGVKKAQENGVPIAQFMVMAWEQFCTRPIEESMRRLREHNKRKLARLTPNSKKRKGVTL